MVAGQTADLCVFDPNIWWRVEPAALHSQGKNTPLLGLELQGPCAVHAGGWRRGLRILTVAHICQLRHNSSPECGRRNHAMRRALGINPVQLQ